MDAELESTESAGGSLSLLDRLEQAKKLFSDPSDVPAEDSEDVIILWLTKLLTTKALELSPQESEAAWKTLEIILSSSQLEALGQKGWICLLDSCFMETLASHVANADCSVQSYAVRITYILLQNPRLSPMVTHRPVHCLILLQGVIRWIIKDHRQDTNVNLALMLTQEIGSFMKSDNDKKASISSVIEHVFLPYVRLCSTSKTEDCENMKKLLCELKQLLSLSLFDETSKQMYMDILSVLFSEETKVSLPEDGSQIFSSLIMFINNEPVELCKHLLYEFLTSFSIAYKNYNDMNHRMTIVLCFIIGVSVKGSNILAINKNNLACQQIIAQQCNHHKQEALLLSVLVAVKDLHFNHDVTLKSICPKRWLNNLSDLIIKHLLWTASGVQCLQTLLQISPKDMVDLILNNFCTIVHKCISDTVNSDDYDTSKDLASATDDLLCDVLQVYSQLREAPSMLINILHSLLKMPKAIAKCTIIPESLYIYDGKLLLPPRFMFQLIKVFSNLVHTNVIATWKVFLTLVTEKFTKQLEESAHSSKFKLVTVAVWLFSCLLRAFPITEIVSVAGVCENVAQLMVQTAKEGIQRLVSMMLTLPHNNDICGSLLVLCHTWGELHIGLCQFDKYVEHPDVSPVQLPEPSQHSTDFSYVLPFISSDIWAQISARVANFGNQPTQLAMVQLVLQKLCFVLHYHQNNFDVRVKCEEESLSPTRQTIEACTKYLLNAVEQWGENIMQLLTFHLPYLITFVHEAHLPTIARYLVTGFKEEKEYWKEYVNSEHFLEAYRLHPHILSCICSSIVSSWNLRKRKFSEADSDLLHKENYALQLITKLSDTKGALCGLSATSSEIKETITDVHRDCGTVFSKLIEKKKSEESLGCVKDMFLLKKLLRRLPFTYLSHHSKNVVMFLLLSTVVNDEYNCTQEKLEILVTTTSLLRNQKSINVLNMIDIDHLLKWLFLKRLTMPLCVHSSQTIPLLQEPAEHVSDFYLKDEGAPNAAQSLDTLISHEFDLLIRYIVDSTESRRTKNLMQSLSDYITTSEELPCDKETRLHVAVLLLWVCQKKNKSRFRISRSRKFMKVKNAETKVAEEDDESRETAFEHLSSWILKFLKKADMATIQPPTAASLLIAHTIILSEEAKNLRDIQNPASQQDSEKEGQTEIHNTAEVKRSKKKTPKCMKLLDHSLKLCELCVLGNNAYLVEHALNFYQKLGEHYSVLCSYLPVDFFKANWVILCNENLWLKNSELKQVLQSCLNSLMLIATDDEFENVLKKLIRDTQILTNISHTLTIWQIVVSSKLDRKKVIMKRVAEEHLTILLINLVTLKSSDMSSDALLSVVETLQVIVKSHSMMSAQSRGLFMKLCTSLPLLQLPLGYFYKIFRILIDIVTSVVVSSSDCVKECIPSILVAVGQFSEALISHSDQNSKLNEQEIKMLVQCSSVLEVFVGSLTSFRPDLKQVIHVALGRIIVCLQNTSVYPDVKVILENVIYHLLGICSQHSFNHLSVTLPSTSATLLKHLHKNYENFYRYHSHVGKRRT
ncbi:uncharacterized protein [Macrobrachium rosenbergii]|uniref:uncharacterized protein n=1 Tax=Macrobrachium rosenbergii TaxID=79674 RepID=UPI0034D6B3C2